jgi:hypothetical protein
MVTAEEKHQLICRNCRFKFAYRRRKSCPGCDTPIAKMANPRFLRYTYYHCGKSKNPSCTQKSLSGENLEKQIDHYLSRIQVSDRFKNWAIRYLHELHAHESALQDEVVRTQQKAYEECTRRIDNLVRLKTAPHNADGSLLSDEEYGRQRLELLKQKAAFEKSLQDAGKTGENGLNLAESLFDFASTARSQFANSDDDTKRKILAATGSNLTLKNKTLSIQALEPFFILETTLQGSLASRGTFEPSNTGFTQGPNRANASCRPDMRACRNDVRTFDRETRRAVKSIYRFFQSYKGDVSKLFPSWFHGDGEGKTRVQRCVGDDKRGRRMTTKAPCRP